MYSYGKGESGRGHAIDIHSILYDVLRIVSIKIQW